MKDDTITTKPITEEKAIVESPEVASTDSAQEANATSAKPTVRKKKSKRAVPYGQMHILATFNNTIVTFSDSTGGALAASSAGACGFRGSKKGTAYAAQTATEKAAIIAKQSYGLSKVDVYVKGVGLGREAAIRALQNLNIGVENIKDVTGVPHGGCRPKKARRV